MGHDRWRNELHQGRQDTGRLADLLRRGVPTDDLQLAGSAVPAATPSTELGEVPSELAESLRTRGWLGDVELATALTDRATGRTSALVRLAVDLDKLASAIDVEAYAVAFIDTESGAVWPSKLIDLGQGPDGLDRDDLDTDDTGRWLSVEGQGSRRAYADMEHFIATVEPGALGDQLRDAINGRKPSKAFLSRAAASRGAVFHEVASSSR